MLEVALGATSVERESTLGLLGLGQFRLGLGFRMAQEIATYVQGLA